MKVAENETSAASAEVSKEKTPPLNMGNDHHPSRMIKENVEAKSKVMREGGPLIKPKDGKGYRKC